MKTHIPYNLNSSYINDRPYFRVQINGKLLHIISSVNGKQPIYVFPL